MGMTFVNGIYVAYEVCRSNSVCKACWSGQYKDSLICFASSIPYRPYHSTKQNIYRNYL